MSTTISTRLIRSPDGGEALLMRCARLTVVKGPDKGRSVVIDQPRLRVGTGADCELQLSDQAVSRQHFELQASERGFVLRDSNSTNGTFVGNVGVQRALLVGETQLRVGDTTLRLAPTRKTVEIPLSQRGSFGGLIGQSQAMRQVIALLERVASSDSTVLLEGESGTGKEVAAEAVHQASRRVEGPLVIVDCGALPPALIESELFGHERGAFTGAEQQHIGVLEQADGGTLFLDEIGELPLELQPRLLRFLEAQEVKRLGASRARHVDVRVIAATNRHLANEVRRGAFREDLFYRLSVVRVAMPALRDRVEDVRLLAYHFAETFARDPHELLGEEVIEILTAYSWPGNVRELRNVVERLVVLPGEALASLRGEAQRRGPEIGALAELPFHEARQRWQDGFERQYLAAQLERTGRNVSQAARQAQIPRQTFHRLLRRHGLGGE
jgi:DNA-binding NtrC family response regulator